MKCGLTLFLEIKKPGGKTTALQDYEMDKLRREGFQCFVVDSLSQAQIVIDNFFIL